MSLFAGRGWEHPGFYSHAPVNLKQFIDLGLCSALTAANTE